MTFENLVPVKNGRLEHADFVIVLTAEADGGKGSHRPPLDCRIDDGGISFDRAYLFQASKPSQARRCRKSDSLGKFVVRDPRIGRQFLEYPAVDRVCNFLRHK